MSVNKTISKLPELTDSLKHVIENVVDDSKSDALTILDERYSLLHGRASKIMTTFRSFKSPDSDKIDRLFFGDDIYPEQPSDFFQEKLHFLEENGRELTKYLAESLGCSLPDVPLFDSPGAMVRIGEKGNLEDSYYDFRNILSSKDGASPVSEKYHHNHLARMAFEKSYFHYLMSLVPVGTPLHTSIVQSYLAELVWEKQYRGGYYNPTTKQTLGVSGSSLNEDVVVAILKNAYPMMDIEDHCRKHECKPYNLIAGLGDECISRILSSDNNQISLIMNSIGDDIKKAVLNDTIGLL